MKLIITIPDEKYEQLEHVAGSQGLVAESFLAKAIDHTLRYNARENQILLRGSDVNALSQAVGGKTLRNAEDVIALFQKNFLLSVDGISFKLTPEDAHALRTQYHGMALEKVLSYEEYVQGIFEDALSLFLYGSTTGKFAYR